MNRDLHLGPALLLENRRKNQKGGRFTAIEGRFGKRPGRRLKPTTSAYNKDFDRFYLGVKDGIVAAAKKKFWTTTMAR